MRVIRRCEELSFRTDGMWRSLISMCIFIVCLGSSRVLAVNREVHHYRRIRLHRASPLVVDSTDQLSPITNSCGTQAINIDGNISSTPDHIVDHDAGPKMVRTHFLSSWERDDHNAESNEDSTSLNTIQLTFTIPYIISTESILNKTVFISDATQNYLLGTLTQICVNGSSFTIKYATSKPLPQNVCLYLLFNLSTSPISFREIFSCQTVYHTNNNDTDSSPSDSYIPDTSHTGGPSAFFILSQCIIILIMMVIIYAVHTARQKRILNRIRQNLLRSRPFVAVFGARAAGLSARASRAGENGSLSNPAATLQNGLQQFVLRHRATTTAQSSAPVPIEEQVLAANDLTSTLNDRRASRAFLKHDLINVKEFTNRISTPNIAIEESSPIELTPPWKQLPKDNENDTETIRSNPVRCEHW